MLLNGKDLNNLASGKLHHDGGGLYLAVLGDSRSWILRYTKHGKTRKIGLGSLKTTTLIEARTKAQIRKGALASGEDPRFLRSRSGAPTFSELAKEIGDRLSKGLKTQCSKDKWTVSLPKYAKAIWDKPVDQINATDIRFVLEPIWVTLPAVAKDIRQKIDTVMNVALTEDLRRTANPATLEVTRKLSLGKQRKVRHHSSMPYAELPAFMAELAKADAPTARLLEILILTCSRTNEVRGMRWDELKMAERLWIIPEERMKMGLEHYVPLTPYVSDLIERLPRLTDSPYVFPSPLKPDRIYCDNAVIVYLKRAFRTDITVHGFRSTFRNWAGEETETHDHVIEHCMAHIIGSQSKKAYWTAQMLKRRRVLLEAWADYALSQVPRYHSTKLRLIASNGEIVQAAE